MDISAKIDVNEIIKDLIKVFKKEGLDPEKITPGVINELWRALHASKRFLEYLRLHGELTASGADAARDFEKHYNAIVKSVKRSSVIGS